MSQETTIEVNAAVGLRRIRRVKKLTPQGLDNVVLPAFLLHQEAASKKTTGFRATLRSAFRPA